MVVTSRMWDTLCAAIDRPELLVDPRFEDMWKRNENGKELYAEIAELDLNKVAKCWDEAQKKLTETSEKKDDQLEPLDRSIVGSTTRDKANVPRWEALGKYLHHWITLRARADKPCVSLCAVQDWTR